MRKITVYVSTGYVGCQKSETFEVEDDCSDEEIDEQAQEIMFGMIEWGWHDAKE
jgi:hypothetical protein